MWNKNETWKDTKIYQDSVSTRYRSANRSIEHGNHLRDYHRRMDDDGPTLRESILGNRGIREKGARRGQRRGKRRRRRGRPRTKGRILPCGPFPPPISRWTFSAVTVHGYWLLLANFFSPPHGNRAAVSNHFRVY